MGLDITKTDDGQYSLLGTIGNESYHPDKKTVSESEAKKNPNQFRFLEIRRKGY